MTSLPTGQLLPHRIPRWGEQCREKPNGPVLKDDGQKRVVMYSVAARSLIRHFFIAAPAFFLCLVQVGSAQTGHPLLVARGGPDQAFHSYISAAEFTRVAPAIDLPSQALLPRAYLPPTSIDSISPHSLG